jgi:phosphopantetheinyl transferase
MGARTPQEKKVICFAIPLRHDEGFLQANSPANLSASVSASVWPDLSPPPFFLTVVSTVFLGRFQHCNPSISFLPLTQDGPPLPLADFLRPDERRQWQSFASGKRQREWLGGRICAYDCARRLAARPEEAFQARDWWLTGDENGRPFWQGNVPQALRGMDISLSHSGAYALAITAPGRVGADVEACRPKVERVAARFCHAEEEDTLARLAPERDRLARLTLLWSAKESLRKAATGLPGFLAMRLVDGNRSDHGWRLSLAWAPAPGAEKQAAVAATLFDGYAFAFCLLEK